MSKLFSSFELSLTTRLNNRIVMAPMTRSRTPNDVPTESVALYYTQRATAGLIISEGAPISREGQGYLFNPGLYLPAQINGWKLVTDSVHSVGGKIFAQLWHVGRVSHTSIQSQGKQPVSSSSKIAKGAMAFGYKEDGSIGMIQSSKPRALSTEEISRVIKDFADAAENAIKAGFDGVEIHGANGYLLEQFLNPLVNDRIDAYSANTIQNRLRFTLDVVDAVVTRIGKSRVGIRLSPYAQVYDMPVFDDIDNTYIALAKELGNRHLAYVHIMDHTRVVLDPTTGQSSSENLDKLLARMHEQLLGTPIILAGGITKERAEKLLEDGVIDLVAFGQPFISNPDLVARLKNNWPLAEANRNTYYGGGLDGYTNYPPYKA